MNASWRTYRDLPMDEFRDRLRTFIRENFPDHLREGFHHPMGRLRGDEGRRWIRALFDHGWRCPHWPVEFGGLGLGVDKQIAYFTEMDEYGVTRILDFGGNQLGPQIIKWGTDAQRAKYLPEILSGKTLWAQGFSEPGSGSDLASLSTRALREGDHFVINGSKIWTTQAADADMLFVLVRTTSTGKKQEGISFLLADMKTPGISLSPIRNIAGEEEFYQLFFDNVAVPAENVVGEVDKGWNVAKTLLGIERLLYGNPIPARRALELAREIARQTGQLDDPALQAKFAVIEADIHDGFCLYDEICSQLIVGGSVEADIALLKVYGTELHQRAADLAVEVASDFAGVAGKTEIGTLIANVTRLYHWVRAPTIFGGTSEIQRNIVARSLLKGG
jgi:alkylation response protein AidB-like acyl-CoA dehydrogenase